MLQGEAENATVETIEADEEQTAAEAIEEGDADGMCLGCSCRASYRPDSMQAVLSFSEILAALVCSFGYRTLTAPKSSRRL